MDSFELSAVLIAAVSVAVFSLIILGRPIAVRLRGPANRRNWQGWGAGHALHAGADMTNGGECNTGSSDCGGSGGGGD